MMKYRFLQFRSSSKGMTLIEILLVTSLIAATSIAIYQSMINGLKVWNKSLQLGAEEDTVIFFEKISHELRNAYSYSKFGFEGDQERFSFPTIIQGFAPNEGNGVSNRFTDQLGRVEYYFDPLDRKIYKRKAFYGQALNGEYQEKRLVASMVDRVEFSYIYFTENGEIKSAIVLDAIPLGVEIVIESSNGAGKRNFKKYIEIPLES